MSKPKSIEISAINIRVQPHPTPRIYSDLFLDAFELKRPIQVHGDRHLLLTAARKFSHEATGYSGIRGEIGRFTKIDTNAKWLNINSLREASKKEVGKVIIPDELKPNFVHFDFFLEEVSHRFFFVSGGTDGALSQSHVLAFLEKLLNSQAIKQKYGKVDLTLEPSSDSLERIFSMPILKRLEIEIRRPNSDDNDDDEEEVLRRMNAQNTQLVKTTLRAVGGQSLKPDKQTKILAKIGAQHGYVQALGQNEAGKKLFESTEDHPAVEIGQFRPDSQQFFDVFMSLVLRLRNRIRKKK